MSGKQILLLALGVFAGLFVLVLAVFLFLVYQGQKQAEPMIQSLF